MINRWTAALAVVAVMAIVALVTAWYWMAEVAREMLGEPWVGSP